LQHAQSGKTSTMALLGITIHSDVVPFE